MPEQRKTPNLRRRARARRMTIVITKQDDDNYDVSIDGKEKLDSEGIFDVLEYLKQRVIEL